MYLIPRIFQKCDAVLRLETISVYGSMVMFKKKLFDTMTKAKIILNGVK